MVESLLPQFVSATVSISAAPLTPRGFGRAAIVGEHTRFAENFRLYTSLQGMVDDGFLTTDPEYKSAQSLLAQSAVSGRKVRDFLVGKRATPVAQVTTLTVTYDGSGQYTVTVDSVGTDPVTVGPVAANTDADQTASDIATAINGSSIGSLVTAAGVGSGGQLTITSDNAGISHSVTTSVSGGSADLTSSVTTANQGIQEDLSQMVTDGAEWYCTLLTSRDSNEILEAATWTESASQVKIFLAQSSEAGMLTGAYDAGTPYADLGSTLKASNYNRTALWYHGADTEYLDAAMAGYALPFDPGGLTWALKALSGFTADSLTSSQLAVLTGTPTNPTGGKNVNVYVPINDSTSRTLRGMMASGRYIDIQRAADYLQNQVETEVANLLLTRAKVPFNDEGIQEIAAAVRRPLRAAQEPDPPILDPETEIVLTVPRAADISAANKTNRVLDPPIEATARMSGAIHFAQVNITVQA